MYGMGTDCTGQLRRVGFIRYMSNSYNVRKKGCNPLSKPLSLHRNPCKHGSIGHIERNGDALRPCGPPGLLFGRRELYHGGDPGQPEADRLLPAGADRGPHRRPAGRCRIPVHPVGPGLDRQRGFRPFRRHLQAASRPVGLPELLPRTDGFAGGPHQVESL